MVNADTASIIATISANAYIGLAVLVVFEYFRRKEPEIFAPRLRTMKNVVHIEPPSQSIFGWMGQVAAVSDQTVLKSVGLDGYVFLRFLKMWSTIGGVCSVIGGLVLIPVYFTAIGEEGVSSIGLYSMANIAPSGERLWASLVAAYVFTLVFLYFTYREYEHFSRVRQQVLVEGDFQIPIQVGFSVQVENIPAEYCSSPKLLAFFNTLFPGEIECANICINGDPLVRVCEERKLNLANLENVIAAYEAAPEKGRPITYLKNGKPVLFAGKCLGDSEADAIDFAKDQISILNEEVGSMQREICELEENGRDPPVVDMERGRKMHASSENAPSDGENNSSTHNTQDSAARAASGSSGTSSNNAIVSALHATAGISSSLKKGVSTQLSNAITVAGDLVLKKKTITAKDVTSTGFVTFKSRKVQAIACQMPILSADYPKLTVEPAPEPSDIIWTNIQRKPEEIEYKAYITSLGFYYGLLFWGTILAFIAAISNLENLQHFLPFLKKLDTTTYALLQGLLPVVILLLFFMYLAAIIRKIVKYGEGRKTESRVQMEVLQWYFMYQIANVYLLLLAGSIFNSLKDAIDDPESIIKLIGAALPSVSVFFMNYIITQLLSGVTLKLLRPGPLIIFKLYRWLINEKELTRRTIVEGPLLDEVVNYGSDMSPSLYLLVIMLLYWVIAPIILILATLLFAATYLRFKYQYLYVFKRKFESNGRFFYVLYRNCMVTLLSSTVLLIGYMAVKLGVVQAPALLPLPVLIIYVWRLTEKNFKGLSLHFPYSSALDADVPLRTIRESEKIMESSSTASAAEEPLLSEDGDGVGVPSTPSTLPSTAPNPYNFSSEFLRLPQMKEPLYPQPYPYRINEKPLFTEKNTLDEVYHVDNYGGAVAYVPPIGSMDSNASTAGSLRLKRPSDENEDSGGKKKKGVKGFMKSIFA